MLVVCIIAVLLLKAVPKTNMTLPQLLADRQCVVMLGLCWVCSCLGLVTVGDSVKGLGFGFKVLSTFGCVPLV